MHADAQASLALVVQHSIQNHIQRQHQNQRCTSRSSLLRSPQLRSPRPPFPCSTWPTLSERQSRPSQRLELSRPRPRHLAARRRSSSPSAMLRVTSRQSPSLPAPAAAGLWTARASSPTPSEWSTCASECNADSSNYTITITYTSALDSDRPRSGLAALDTGAEQPSFAYPGQSFGACSYTACPIQAGVESVYTYELQTYKIVSESRAFHRACKGPLPPGLEIARWYARTTLTHSPWTASGTTSQTGPTARRSSARASRSSTPARHLGIARAHPDQLYHIMRETLRDTPKTTAVNNDAKKESPKEDLYRRRKTDKV